MDIQKEREAFQKFCEENFDFEHHEQTYFDEQAQCYENDIGEDTDSINMAWKAWQAAKAVAVPEGFVLVPVKEIKTWYLDDDENIYREDPDWLCDTPIGEVVEVEHRVSYEIDQDPVFAAIQWDEANNDVGFYETFKSKEEAEKVAVHCKAMKEAQEQGDG